MLVTKKKYHRTPRYLTQLSRKMRREGTPVEQLLWQKLSNRQLSGLRFRSQHPVGRYIVDFYNQELRLSVEIDGDIHFDQKKYDKNRDDFLKASGCTVIRFNNGQVISNLQTVLDTIVKTAASIKSPFGGFRGPRQRRTIERPWQRKAIEEIE